MIIQPRGNISIWFLFSEQESWVEITLKIQWTVNRSSDIHPDWAGGEKNVIYTCSSCLLIELVCLDRFWRVKTFLDLDWSDMTCCQSFEYWLLKRSKLQCTNIWQNKVVLYSKSAAAAGISKHLLSCPCALEVGEVSLSSSSVAAACFSRLTDEPRYYRVLISR